MYTPALTLLRLLYVVQSAAPKKAYDPVMREELPSRTYRAKGRGTVGICPALPGLTDFEMIVWEDKGQQVASLRAQVGDEWSTTSGEFRLVWYNDNFIKETKGIFGTHQLSECFRPARNSGSSSVSGNFAYSLYQSTNRADVGRSRSVAFCFLMGSSDILVLIGLVTRNTRLTAFDASILLGGPADRTAHNAVLPASATPLEGRKRERAPKTAKQPKNRNEFAPESTGLNPRGLSLELSSIGRSHPDKDLMSNSFDPTKNARSVSTRDSGSSVPQSGVVDEGNRQIVARQNADFQQLIRNGVYEAKSVSSAAVCPTLRGLTDFRMEVWESGGQQLATVKATVRWQSVSLKKQCRLVWYEDVFTQRLKLAEYGLPDLKARCFHLSPIHSSARENEVSTFVGHLYSFTRALTPTGNLASQIVFCDTSGGLLVGIGVEKDSYHLYGFDHAFLLRRSEATTTDNEAHGGVASPSGQAALELVEPVGSGEPPDSTADQNLPELWDLLPELSFMRAGNPHVMEEGHMVNEETNVSGDGESSDSRIFPSGTLPDGDYETFYGTARIGVGITTNSSTGRRMITLELKEKFGRKVAFAGVSTTTDDNCMQLALPATDWSLSVHAIRSFLDHNNFIPNNICIRYKTDLGWSLEFHERDSGSPRGADSTGVLKLNLLHAQQVVGRCWQQRILKACTQNHPRHGEFCKAVAKACMVSSSQDYEQAVAANLKAGGNGQLSEKQLREKVNDPQSDDFEQAKEGGARTPRRGGPNLRGLRPRRGLVADLIATIGPHAEDIYKAYQKRAFSELNAALESGKPPVPSPSITVGDIRLFARELHNKRAGMPLPVSDMKSVVELESKMRGGEEHVPQVLEPVHPAVVKLSGSRPPLAPEPATGADILNDWMNRGPLKGAPITANTENRAGPSASSTSTSEKPSSGESVLEKEPTRRPSMICKWCGKPLAPGYNSHEMSPNGGKYGICPEAPKAEVERRQKRKEEAGRAKERAKSLTVENKQEGSRCCGICSLPFKTIIKSPNGECLPMHERFLEDDQKTAVHFCPVAENIAPERLAHLRGLKRRRKEDKAQRKKENKRRRRSEHHKQDEISEGFDLMDLNELGW
ncbi:hypothetical protein FOZ61_008319 [Perkinsus olseni]|uniref:Uncharacterized protein n=1 Tax=Perkinsus olseni TaxID=32597 RepID=A0A7J6LDX6_PEROL|nr:hypothetical protein FOZ61_008319 [Perkinsus olseni]KAF4657458.1 hypothetical protein FOL46_007416 [Perkinsus olseni]